jgi:hypothetical protein
VHIFDIIVLALRSEKSKIMYDKLCYWRLESSKSYETTPSA